ncbi:hypothetical protein ABH37_06665 [Mycobacterium haemophilum]|uniref:Uncharacterized protein n=1 Tax=Mycobacterium haemophilum TaxID=29311 RepID=A0A0I9TVD8_9MYCO|nr:hypothetical protein ABH39_04300 [Mycobacterium haemophilum]KLO37070.1 hypothetical protein ABH38_09140 [Mycobacterium haemophilum]KLO43543.1 hypothetical protein ABH37_06665 [Mycobacterium haemophilum]KLO55901.1 hypothetical protein ABH36_03815 [Mycobacterium haemophilum]
MYVRRDAELTPALRAKALWLRSRRRGILAGFRRGLEKVQQRYGWIVVRVIAEDRPDDIDGVTLAC